MMGGVSPETCWASYKYGIIKVWYIAVSCWIFLYELYYDARIHKHQVYHLLIFELDKTENNYAEYKRWEMAADMGIKRPKRHIPEKMLVLCLYCKERWRFLLNSKVCQLPWPYYPLHPKQYIQTIPDYSAHSVPDICIAHETAISCNPPIHSFTGDTKSLTDPLPTNT